MVLLSLRLTSASSPVILRLFPSRHHALGSTGSFRALACVGLLACMSRPTSCVEGESRR